MGHQSSFGRWTRAHLAITGARNEATGAPVPIFGRCGQDGHAHRGEAVGRDDMWGPLAGRGGAGSAGRAGEVEAGALAGGPQATAKASAAAAGTRAAARAAGARAQAAGPRGELGRARWACVVGGPCALLGCGERKASWAGGKKRKGARPFYLFLFFFLVLLFLFSLIIVIHRKSYKLNESATSFSIKQKHMLQHDASIEASLEFYFTRFTPIYITK